MKILCVNAGSSSLKFQLVEMPEEKVLINGYIERIGLASSFWTIKLNGEKIKKEVNQCLTLSDILFIIDEILFR